MKADTKVPTNDFWAAHEFQPTCTMCEIHPALWIVNWHGCISTLRCDDCWNYEKTNIYGIPRDLACGHCRKVFKSADAIVSVEPIDPH
jgi:hypothetical protein